MGRWLIAATAMAALSLLAAAGTQAADWELWPDPATPPSHTEGLLPLLPNVAPGLTLATETDSSILAIDVRQTREKDGQLYKAIQFYRDTAVEDTVEVGQWVHGGPDNFLACPPTVDVMAFMRAWRLIAMEVDGTRIPIDMDTWLHEVGYDLGGDCGVVPQGWYSVAVRYNVPGPHTYRAIFHQVEEHFVVMPSGPWDPTPEFEGRRVFIGETVGDPVDGDVVYTCNLTVVAPTAVEPCGWARVKAALQE